MTSEHGRDAAYVPCAQAHMARYKREVLAIEEDGVWGRQARSYPHILPSKSYRANILPSIRNDFWVLQESRHWKRHKYFHHLTSSQALAFNLFFPLVAGWERASAPYDGAFGLPDGTTIEADLEVVLEEAEGTNFDAILKGSDGARLLVEVKFTEGAFGSAPNDARHQEKLKNIYRGRLEGLVPDRCLEEAEFFGRYQLYRNLAEALRDNHTRLVLLLPAGHTSIWGHASEWLRDLGDSPAASRVVMVALEDVIENLKAAATASGPRFQLFVSEFARKYDVNRDG